MRSETNVNCSMHVLLNYFESSRNQEAKSLLDKLQINYRHLSDDLLGSTLLHYAAKWGNTEMVQYLIDTGCNIDAQDNSGVTPLMLAVKNEKLLTTEVLVNNNADIYMTDFNGMSSIQLAFHLHFTSRPVDYHIYPKKISRIFSDKLNSDFIEGASMQSLLNANNSVKLAAVSTCDVGVVKFLLDNGYPINFYENEWEYTALLCAMTWKEVDNVKILIERGASVDEVDERGASAVEHYLSRFQYIDENCDLLKRILKSSTSLSLQRRISDMTDVENILMKGKKKTVRTLLLSGIDLETCVHNDRSVVHCIIQNRNENVLDIFDELKIAVNVNQSISRLCHTPMLPALAKCPKKSAFLLQHSADPILIGLAAIKSAYTDVADVIKLVFEYGADAQLLFNQGEVNVIYNMSSNYAKIILAHLAILGAVEQATLTDSTRDKIKSSREVQCCFDFYTNQLVELKNIKINNGAVTMFNLLTDTEERLVSYVRHQDFKSGFQIAMNNSRHLEPYYLDILKKKVSTALATAKLQEKSALAIEELTGCCSDIYRHVVFKIISYLSHQDLNNLCKIDKKISRF